MQGFTRIVTVLSHRPWEIQAKTLCWTSYLASGYQRCAFGLAFNFCSICSLTAQPRRYSRILPPLVRQHSFQKATSRRYFTVASENSDIESDGGILLSKMAFLKESDSILDRICERLETQLEDKRFESEFDVTYSVGIFVPIL